VSFLAGDLVVLVSAVVCVELEPFELSGGTEAFEDESRR
jgi:hypothetical protein